MLQIIGWLGCAYLVVKGFELLGAAESRVQSGSGNTGNYEKTGAGLSLIAAISFAAWLFVQGQEIPKSTEEVDIPDYIDVNVN